MKNKNTGDKLKKLRAQKAQIEKECFEKEVQYIINFFKENGKIITKEEAKTLAMQMSDLPSTKDFDEIVRKNINAEIENKKLIKKTDKAIKDETEKLFENEKRINELLNKKPH